MNIKSLKYSEKKDSAVAKNPSPNLRKDCFLLGLATLEVRILKKLYIFF